MSKVIHTLIVGMTITHVGIWARGFFAGIPIDRGLYEQNVKAREQSLCDLFKRALQRSNPSLEVVSCESSTTKGFQVCVYDHRHDTTKSVNILGLRAFVSAPLMSHDQRDYENTSLEAYQKVLDEPISGLAPDTVQFNAQDALALFCAAYAQYDPVKIAIHLRTMGLSREQMVRSLIKYEQRIKGLLFTVGWLTDARTGLPQALGVYQELIRKLIG